MSERRRFGDDERGVSEVLGAVLVFGLLVSLVVLAQVTLIPDQNARVEFQHSEEIQRDMVDLRNGMVQASSSGNPTSVTLATGTQYPSRLLFLNPPIPTGSFGTIDGGTISTDDGELNIRSVCGTSGPATTNFMRYGPSYNEYDQARPVIVENSVVHRSETGSESLFDTEQILIRGNQITIIRTVGDISPTSGQTTSIDLFPSETGVTTVDSDADNSGELSITIPSELTVSDWDELTTNEPFVRTVEPNGSNVRIVLEPPNGTAGRPNEYNVRCTTIGLNEQPSVNPPTAPPGGGGGGSNGSQINPIGSNEIVFRDATIINDRPNCSASNSKCRVDVTFENSRANDVKIVQARYVFYSIDTQGSGVVSPRNPPEIVEYRNTTFDIRGSQESVDGHTISNGTTEDVDMYFKVSTNQPYGVVDGDWFIVRIIFEDQSTGEKFLGRYFIPPESS